MKIILLSVCALLLAVTAVLFFRSSSPLVMVDPPVKVIGVQTPVRIRVQNPHGLRRITLTVQQDGKPYLTKVADAPARRVFLESNAAPREFIVSAGKQSAPALHDGKARIIIEAVSNDFRAKATQLGFDVDVITAPPRVTADGVQHYINQGGSEMATFTPSGAWTEAGVKVGDRTFRSFPLPNHPGEYFSLFAFSWQLPPETPVSVYAGNPSGAMARTNFWYKVFPKKFRSSTLALETMNLDRMVNQIDPEHKVKGDLVERFVYINREMRKQNNKTLADLRFATEPRFLWAGAFLPMVDSTVESRFADDRTYTWQGRKVDQQTHLGFDLAKLAHSPIPASNDGKVVFEDNLGIYGNCIVIDHGFGLQSIYGHMSEFLVKKGEMVKKGQIIGKTGMTGMAGGDHLHFTMQVDGVQVNAVEWWDPHWVKDRILSKMGAALPPEEAEKVKGGYPAPRRQTRRRTAHGK